MPAVMAIWWPKLRANDRTLYRGSAGRQPLQQLQRLVARAVVDEDDLPGLPTPLPTFGKNACKRRDSSGMISASLNIGSTSERVGPRIGPCIPQTGKPKTGGALGPADSLANNPLDACQLDGQRLPIAADVVRSSADQFSMDVRTDG